MSRAEKSLLLRSFALLPIVALSLRLFGFRRTQALLAPPLSPAGARPAGDAAALQVRIFRTARMVRAAAHHAPLRPTCLAESLTLWRLLRRQGLEARLRIGVRKVARRFEAHAWVEQAGVALNDAEALHRHYAAFDSSFADPPVEPS